MPTRTICSGSETDDRHLVDQLNGEEEREADRLTDYQKQVDRYRVVALTPSEKKSQHVWVSPGCTRHDRDSAGIPTES